MSKDFGLEVTALIAQHYPAALMGDPGQIGACSAQLADCMGGLLAFALKLAGPEVAEKCITGMVDRIVKTATGVDAKAEAILRTGISKPVGH